MRRLWAQLALVLVGLVALGWALTVAANPTITCRGTVMGPGDVCANADGTRVQSYEQRLAAHQDARPVIGAVGVVVAGFGAALSVAELRRRRSASVA